MGCEIIAELHTSHGGDIALAKEFIKRCAEAGAHWVKFQSYQTKHLRPSDPQEAWLKQAELSDEAHHVLKSACEAAGIKFLTTVFTADRVPFLVSLGLEAIKIGSGESFEVELVRAATRTQIQSVFVSHDIGQMALWDARARYFRCISRYPAPLEYARSVVRLVPPDHQVGWSDHCIGLAACEDAIMGGAQYVEKHMTFVDAKRPAQAWEMTLAELKQLRKFVDDGPERFIGRWQANL